MTMEQCTLKIVNNYLNANIYSYLETSGGQSSNIYLNVVYFSTPELIRHLWQLETSVLLHWCLLCALLLASFCSLLHKVVPKLIKLVNGTLRSKPRDSF
jgi:hypothetical protein